MRRERDGGRDEEREREREMEGGMFSSGNKTGSFSQIERLWLNIGQKQKLICSADAVDTSLWPPRLSSRLCWCRQWNRICYRPFLKTLLCLAWLWFAKAASMGWKTSDCQCDCVVAASSKQQVILVLMCAGGLNQLVLYTCQQGSNLLGTTALKNPDIISSRSKVDLQYKGPTYPAPLL